MELHSTKIMPFILKKIISAEIWQHVDFPKPFAKTVAAITARRRSGLPSHTTTHLPCEEAPSRVVGCSLSASAISASSPALHPPSPRRLQSPSTSQAAPVKAKCQLPPTLHPRLPQPSTQGLSKARPP